jgi:diguanylate cyclase (GGDEF)-like protein/PAS domain S-box-containing protein
MTAPRKQYLLWVGEWGLAFAFVVAAALLSGLFTRNAEGVSSIWLANGIILGFLLNAPSRRWAGLLGAFVLGQITAAIVAPDPVRGILAAMVFNSLEVGLAAWTLRNRITAARDLSHAANFAPFLAVVLLAPLVSGLAVLGWLGITSQMSGSVFVSWYAGHALGLATGTPVMLALRGNALPRVFRREHRLETVLSTMLIVVVTVAVFIQDKYSLQYMVFPVMLLAALRGGFTGTAFALILVTGIAAILTGLGHGPLMLIQDADGHEVALMLQVYVAVLLLTCFPVAVGMAAWRRQQRTERKLRTLLGLLAEHSSDVIVLTDLDGRRVFVSPSVRDVLGWEPEEFLRGTFRELVHPAHFEEVDRQLDQLRRAQGGKATITFPTRRKDGRSIWLEARVRHFRDADFLTRNEGRGRRPGRPEDEEGFVVTLRNVTRRRQTEQALEEANRKLTSLVFKDELTGLGNRRFFDQLLAEYWQQCGRSGLPMALILLDVDHFKLYNDRYGHQQGDHCLREVARSISNGVRGTLDCAARYGGEEFAVVLAQTDGDEARQVAERIRSDIELLAMPHVGSPFGHVTVSVGLASCVPADEHDPGTLVKAADRALYESKSTGRNRTTAHLAQPEATQKLRPPGAGGMPEGSG